MQSHFLLDRIESTNHPSLVQSLLATLALSDPHSRPPLLLCFIGKLLPALRQCSYKQKWITGRKFIPGYQNPFPLTDSVYMHIYKLKVVTYLDRYYLSGHLLHFMLHSKQKRKKICSKELDQFDAWVSELHVCIWGKHYHTYCFP